MHGGLNTSSRFTFCMMDLADPFGLAFAGDRFGWIFVEKAQLDLMLSSKATVPCNTHVPAFATKCVAGSQTIPPSKHNVEPRFKEWVALRVEQDTTATQRGPRVYAREVSTHSGNGSAPCGANWAPHSRAKQAHGNGRPANLATNLASDLAKKKNFSPKCQF